jgi:hypothetical protein
VGEIGPQRVERRREPGAERHDCDQAERDTKGVDVDELLAPEMVRQQDLLDVTAARVRHRQGDAGSDHREQCRLCQQLPAQASPAHAQREPDRDLTSARERARDQDVCDIRHRDEEHDDGDTEQPYAHLRGVARTVRMTEPVQRGDERSASCRKPRPIVLRQFRLHVTQRRRRLCTRDGIRCIRKTADESEAEPARRLPSAAQQLSPERFQRRP